MKSSILKLILAKPSLDTCNTALSQSLFAINTSLNKFALNEILSIFENSDEVTGIVNRDSVCIHSRITNN